MLDYTLAYTITLNTTFDTRAFDTIPSPSPSVATSQASRRQKHEMYDAKRLGFEVVLRS
jgi:hypothetical protein